MTTWLADMLVATSLLMAAVLIVRPLVRRLFGAGAAYALWLVPALRLILPPLDLSSPGLPALGAVEIVRVAAPASPAAMPWLLAIWATGAAGFALWQLVGYQVFLRRALSGASAEDGGVFATGAVAGPAADGLLVPRILLPLDFHQRFSPAERVLAVAHERTHQARGDLWASAAALVILCLHWFNPLAWAAHRAFREDQELSCDAAVIGRAGAEQRAVYAAAMVKSAWGAAPSYTCPMSRTGNLVRRLKMLKTHRKSAWAKAGGAITVGAAALAGLTLTATGLMAQESVAGIKKITVKRVGTQADGKATADALIAEHCGTSDSFQTEMPGTVDGKNQKRVVFCAKPGAAPVGRVAALEKARASMATSDKLSPAERAQVSAGINALIAKAKAEQ